MPEKILVVDDEKPIAEIVKFNLEREGYEVAVAYNGLEALAMAESNQPDLILLDIMLPKLDGIEVCRQLRKTMTMPIVMLTAKDSEADIVLGLGVGADDYVTKPFSTREVTARVKALLRRVKVFTEADAKAKRMMEFGHLVIDLDKYEVTKRGQTLDLTFREFELLKYLAAHHGRVLTREQLLEEVWGYDYYGDLRTVDVTIRRLREKVEDDPSNPQYIETRRGVGYLFRR